MIATNSTLETIMARGKELSESPKWPDGPTLQDLLDVFPLTKFKELLTETGLIDLLKQRSTLTVLAPTDQALTETFAQWPSEIDPKKRMERLQTFARSHIIATSLSRRALNMVGQLSVERTSELIQPLLATTYDMNGDIIDFRLDLAQFGAVLHSVNGVRPISPKPYGSTTASASNGELIILTESILGKSFLEQQYHDRSKEAFPDGSDMFTTWEALMKLGLTTFCDAVEAAGLADVLQKGDAEAIRVLAPINETLSRFWVPFKQKSLRKFVESHFFDARGNSLYNGQPIDQILPLERIRRETFNWPTIKYRTANGSFTLFGTCFTLRPKMVGWELNLIPYDDRLT